MTKGLKVQIVLWHLEDKKNFSSKHARLWIRGEARKMKGTKPEGKKEFFNDAGQLLTLLGSGMQKSIEILGKRTDEQKKEEHKAKSQARTKG